MWEAPGPRRPLCNGSEGHRDPGAPFVMMMVGVGSEAPPYRAFEGTPRLGA